MPTRRTFLLATCLPMVPVPRAAAMAAGDWRSGFPRPSPGCRMGVYWWWFGPAVTKPEVARELEVMRRAGIGYVVIFPLYPISTGNHGRRTRGLKYLAPGFLSPGYLDVLAHTTRTARRLGITVDLLMGTGWPYGGPAISRALSTELLRVVMEPATGQTRLRRPPLRAGEQLAAVLLVRGGEKQVDLDDTVDLTPRFREHETVTLTAAPPGPRVLMSFLASPSGWMVENASVGGEGLVMDHLSREALETYANAVGGKLLSAVAPGTVRAVHSDSMEVYGQDWTSNLLQAFSERRGYNLKPYLPALVADAGPLTRDVRYDFWRTLSEMALDNYVRPLHEWCRKHGVSLQAESYGTPPVDMRSFSEVDYPAGESYDWKMFVASRWASSAAHQYGKNLVAAEAYTWLRHPRYISTLQDVKLGSDLHFICGINKLIAHGYAYSPPAAGVPGWGYYASVMLNDNNPWWPYFHLLSDYVRRVSYALRLGKPMVDVALYLPEDDVMASQPSGHQGLNLYMETKYRLGGKRVPEFGLPAAYRSETDVIRTLITSGYTFDGIDHSILQPGLKTSAGRLDVGDVSYRIAVLPNLTGISLPILNKLADFCRAGGVLVATRRLPEVAYGVKNREANYQRVKTLIRELFGDGPGNRVRRHVYGRGTAIYVPDETDELAKVLVELGPEIRFERPDAELVFIHRGQGNRQLYFLANTAAEKKDFKVTFRDGKGQPQFWDAMNGKIEDAPEYRSTSAGTEVPLKLDPYGSILVYFDGTTRSAPHPVRKKRPTRIIPVPGPWLLSFGGGSAVRLAHLKSWTTLPDRRFYSGRGDYRFEVDLSKELLGSRRGVWLDLGEVREIADITINGHDAGVCWKLPYQLDITRWARPGTNVVEVGVTNLLINRVLGEPAPDYSGLKPLRFPAPHEKLRFPMPQEKKLIPEPLPSGLLGPVRIIAYEVH